ncbi:hypothetical protein [Paenibacillus taichungensis]
MVYYFFNPKRKGIRAILSMSAKEPGRYQITYFIYSQYSNKFIPSSDSIRDNIRVCLEQLDDEGFQREKVKRFDLFEVPEAFVPTRIIPMTRCERMTERLLREWGIESSVAV